MASEDSDHTLVVVHRSNWNKTMFYADYSTSKTGEKGEAHEIVGIHRVSPPFTEEEKYLRRGKWYMHPQQAPLYPRFPDNLKRFWLFVDKEDNTPILARLFWAGRSAYPNLRYMLHGSAAEIYSDFDEWIAISSLLSRFPIRSYIRKSFAEFPTRDQLPIDLFKEEREWKDWEEYRFVIRSWWGCPA